MMPRRSYRWRNGRMVMRLVPLALLLTTGCAEVGFKRGAMPGDLSADEASCRAETADAGAYRACLRERGWYVAAPAAPPRAAPPATGDASPATTSSAPPAGADLDGGAPGPAILPPAAPSTSTAAPTSTTTSADITDSIAVRSWWKLGASAADLDTDIETCVAALGAAHRPIPGTGQVTVGLDACLRERGWRGMGG